MTMTLVSTVTVGAGGVGSFSFTNIPQTATDVYLTLSLRTDYASVSQNIYILYNNTGTGYTGKQLWGNGQTAYSSTFSSGDLSQADGANATTNTFSNGSVYIPNYAGSTNKSYSMDVVTENNAPSGVTVSHNITAGLWSNTAGITQIDVYAGGQTLAQYSTASLYIITKGSGGATVS